MKLFENINRLKKEIIRLKKEINESKPTKKIKISDGFVSSGCVMIDEDAEYLIRGIEVEVTELLADTLRFARAAIEEKENNYNY